MPTQNLHLVGGMARDSDTDLNSPGIYSPGFPLDQDADGVIEPTKSVICDLSEMLSYRLGKQIPMTANFRINYLKVSLRNVNDGNDNDGPNYFAGDWEWYTPTAHRIDAVQAWRGLERRLEEDEVDIGLMQGKVDDEYKGFRFGWNHSNTIKHATPGAPAELPNGYALTQMLSVYNDALDNDGAPTRGRSLWDRKVGRSSHLGWSAVCENGFFQDVPGPVNENYDTAFIRDGEWTAPHGHAIEVLGGLLVLNITHSSVDNVQNIDDNFHLQIDIGVSGWSSW